MVLCEFMTVDKVSWNPSPSLGRSLNHFVKVSGVVVFYLSWYTIWNLNRERYCLYYADSMLRDFFDIKNSIFSGSNKFWIRLSTDSSSAHHFFNTFTIVITLCHKSCRFSWPRNSSSNRRPPGSKTCHLHIATVCMTKLNRRCLFPLLPLWSS